jgi:hypothetical protein
MEQTCAVLTTCPDPVGALVASMRRTGDRNGEQPGGPLICPRSVGSGRCWPGCSAPFPAPGQHLSPVVCGCLRAALRPVLGWPSTSSMPSSDQPHSRRTIGGQLDEDLDPEGVEQHDLGLQRGRPPVTRMVTHSAGHQVDDGEAVRRRPTSALDDKSSFGLRGNGIDSAMRPKTTSLTCRPGACWSVRIQPCSSVERPDEPPHRRSPIIDQLSAVLTRGGGRFSGPSSRPMPRTLSWAHPEYPAPYSWYVYPVPLCVWPSSGANPGDKQGVTRRIWYTWTDEHVYKSAGQHTYRHSPIRPG